MSTSQPASPKPLATGQTTRTYRRRVGGVEVTTLLDGYVELSLAVWAQIAPADADAALAARGLRPGGVRNPIQAFLLNDGQKLRVIDAGAAGLFGPHSHAFPGILGDAGVMPGEIDEVLVTHLHPDHIGGLLANGQATLPNAILRVAETELAFWTSADAQARAPEFMRSWFDLCRGLAAAYDGRIETFRPGAALPGGISTIAFPGHTPGMTGYVVENAGARALFWGDLAVSAPIQFPNPRAHMIFDIDGEEGLKSRLRGFGLAVSENLAIAGTHLPFPSFGFVRPRDGAFEYIAEEWRLDPTEAPLAPVI